MKKFRSPSFLIRTLWPRMNWLPGGKRLFAFFLARFIPYTGSMGPLIQKIDRGLSEVLLRDRKAVRNHLDSIHAIALINVGELASGLALMSLLQDTQMGILVKIEAHYLKKARGDLVAKGFCSPIPLECQGEWPVTSEIYNQAGEVACRVFATWSIRSFP
jgi:acyl-coenzyme A thioesterase PaaI-like protein